MATQHPTDAEAFQRFLNVQVMSEGRNKTPEELVRIWRDRQREFSDSLKAIEEGLADVEAGRVFPFAEVNDEIRRQHGWPAAE
jgi:predicted transcriptional regulator